jgi:hypothetical protein
MEKCQQGGTTLTPQAVTNMLPIVGGAPKKYFDTVPNDNNCATVFSKILESKTITAEKVRSYCTLCNRVRIIVPY